MGQRGIGIVLVSGCLALVACGSVGGSEFGDGSDPNGGGAGGGQETFGGGVGGPGSGPTLDEACVSSRAGAQLTPVNLVIMYDKSGSMGDPNNQPPFDPNLKWIPVGTAMKSFFADARSAGMKASLQYFPIFDAQFTVATTCGSKTYETPSVSLRQLPDATTFAQSIDATSPMGNTPTRPALAGAIDYAISTATAAPDEHTFVVLVTDGEPTLCDNGGIAENINLVTAQAERGANNNPSIKTYVIGVGTAKANMDKIAKSGGTQQAIVVDTNNPAQTNEDFQKAMEQIRGTALTCSFAIPPAPDGKVIDKNAVNVQYTDGGGATNTLTYNADCAGGAGWHYDDPAAPQKIVLCDGTCQTTRADAGGKVSIAFGCATLGNIR